MKSKSTGKKHIPAIGKFVVFGCLFHAANSDILPAGTYITLENRYFQEKLVLNHDKTCRYSITSDVKIQGGGRTGGSTGKYDVIDDTLMVRLSEEGPLTRQIRTINGIPTLWRDDALLEWAKNKDYRLYGIMILFSSGLDHTVERLLTNQVNGVRIEPNAGQILLLLPETVLPAFKAYSAGQQFIAISGDSSSWISKQRKCYEFDLAKNHSHVRNGIYIEFHPKSDQVASIHIYKDGQWNGPALLYYENGKRRRQESFKNGERHGHSTQWNEQGNMAAEVEYENGKPFNGKVREPDWANPTPGKYLLSEYKKGKRVRTLPCDEQGNILTNDR